MTGVFRGSARSAGGFIFMKSCTLENLLLNIEGLLGTAGLGYLFEISKLPEESMLLLDTSAAGDVSSTI
jgi:hypothetical protein